MIYYENDYLAHYGVPGMKWGIRRYQNPDGTLTEAGKRRNQAAVTKIAKFEKKYRKTEAKAKARMKRAESRIFSRYNPMNPTRPVVNALRKNFVVNKVAYKGQKRVNKYIKKGLPLDEKTITLGKEWTERTTETSKAIYNAALEMFMKRNVDTYNGQPRRYKG